MTPITQMTAMTPINPINPMTQITLMTLMTSMTPMTPMTPMTLMTPMTQMTQMTLMTLMTQMTAINPMTPINTITLMTQMTSFHTSLNFLGHTHRNYEFLKDDIGNDIRCIQLASPLLAQPGEDCFGILEFEAIEEMIDINETVVKGTIKLKGSGAMMSTVIEKEHVFQNV